jgi:hypothetical protein
VSPAVFDVRNDTSFLSANNICLLLSYTYVINPHSCMKSERRRRRRRRDIPLYNY